MTAIPTQSTTKELSLSALFAWMERALHSPQEAEELLFYLNERPYLRDSLNEEEGYDFDIKWQRVWRRLSGQMPFST